MKTRHGPYNRVVDPDWTPRRRTSSTTHENFQGKTKPGGQASRETARVHLPHGGGEPDDRAGHPRLAPSTAHVKHWWTFQWGEKQNRRLKPRGRRAHLPTLGMEEPINRAGHLTFDPTSFSVRHPQSSPSGGSHKGSVG